MYIISASYSKKFLPYQTTVLEYMPALQCPSFLFNNSGRAAFSKASQTIPPSSLLLIPYPSLQTSQ